jgi:hypothetical protein
MQFWSDSETYKNLTPYICKFEVSEYSVSLVTLEKSRGTGGE